PAGGELDLQRGGNHIMFMKLKQRPEQGDKVSVELHFEKADPIKVTLPVKETTYNPKKQ
ncbi:copper chaperone PCu(A)C, partial [Streptomyces mirabilis]